MKSTRMDDLEVGDLTVHVKTVFADQMSRLAIGSKTETSFIAIDIDPEEIGHLIRILEAHANIGMGKEDA